ncbi:MAG: hypothetical protein H6550_00985 [Chitinophagales bacterium]|nr:hypothetical protein [Chitinophagales bacterium]
MNTVAINFENCYGIGKLSHDFDFNKTNTFLIYAPNGTMKTSLAKTLRYFTNEKVATPCDQIYTDRVSKYEMKINGVGYKKGEEDNILIIDPEVTNYDASNKISSFLASKELKERFDKIYEELDKQKAEFIKKLKLVSKSNDCESEIISTFKTTSNETFFDVLDRVMPSLKSDLPKYSFRYNDIFDSKGNVQKFLAKHQDDLNTYVEHYESLISKSSFFKKSDNSFGTYQAGQILKSTEDGSFFEAGHSLDLEGDIKVASAKDLKSLLETEIAKIVDNQDLKKVFDKVDKAIGSNSELRVFQKAIEQDNLLLVELKDYEEFKKKAWIGYLSEILADAKALHDFYVSQKEDLSVLLDMAKEEQEIWKILVEQFNSRFHVPFRVELANQQDVILKQDLAILNFQYSDRKEQPSVKQEKENLFNNVLSRGEKRAFYILQILFEIESRKLAENPTLIIFDDIADSFDYKNKYAIVEYIRDLHELENFKIIILTHNFDFYRTIAKRLNLHRERDFCAFLMAVRDDNGIVTLSNGAYINDLFNHFLDRIAEQQVFVSLIPFLRNIIEYTEGDDSDEYQRLTMCLHRKTGSDEISIDDILHIWRERFKKHQNKFDEFEGGDKKIIQLIYDTADAIIADRTINEIAIENKIVLSIAIRLKAEDFMIAQIPGLNIDEIKSNQTQELFKRYKLVPGKDDVKIKIIDKVAIMTPENIHLNSFMYEPLIDISVHHLVNLYSEVSSL